MSQTIALSVDDSGDEGILRAEGTYLVEVMQKAWFDILTPFVDELQIRKDHGTSSFDFD